MIGSVAFEAMKQNRLLHQIGMPADVVRSMSAQIMDQKLSTELASEIKDLAIICDGTELVMQSSYPVSDPSSRVAVPSARGKNRIFALFIMSSQHRSPNNKR